VETGTSQKARSPSFDKFQFLHPAMQSRQSAVDTQNLCGLKASC